MTHWPHAPPHFLKDQGIYMITAGTYLKVHYFKAPDRLQLLHDRLLSLSQTYACELHAWAVFSNHYHFIAKSLPDPPNLSSWLAILHQSTTSEVNSIDQTPNRKVWHQFWDTKITFPTSYLARLNYVDQNPVKHGLGSIASQYDWCSAKKFEVYAKRSFVKSVYSFDFTKVNVYDTF